jgi:hypothetical protein
MASPAASGTPYHSINIARPEEGPGCGPGASDVVSIAATPLAQPLPRPPLLPQQQEPGASSCARCGKLKYAGWLLLAVVAQLLWGLNPVFARYLMVSACAASAHRAHGVVGGLRGGVRATLAGRQGQEGHVQRKGGALAPDCAGML